MNKPEITNELLIKLSHQVYSRFVEVVAENELTDSDCMVLCMGILNLMLLSLERPGDAWDTVTKHLVCDKDAFMKANDALRNLSKLKDV